MFDVELTPGLTQMCLLHIADGVLPASCCVEEMQRQTDLSKGFCPQIFLLKLRVEENNCFKNRFSVCRR